MAYALYLLCLILLALGIVSKGIHSRAFETIFFSTIAVFIVITCIISGFFVAIGIRAPTAFWAIAVLSAALGTYLLRTESILAANKARISAVAIAIAGTALLTPVAAAVISPIGDIDSLAAFETVLNWSSRKIGILDHVWDYPATWELIYYPALPLGQSINMLWFPGLLVVLAIAAIVYSIALRLELPDWLAGVTAFGALTHYTLWGGGSGATTLKNDMIVIFGTLLIIDGLISIRNKDYSSSAWGQIGIGTAFASIKYSGAIYVPAILLLALTMLDIAQTSRAIANLKRLALLLLPALVLTFPYYLENIISYHNPFYPMTLKLGPIGFPGSGDLSGTSILSHILEPKLWLLLLGLSDLHVLGLIFGAIWPLALLSTFVLFCHAAIHRTKLSPEKFVLATAAMLIFFYFKAFWSAGPTPDSLAYLEQGNISSRYAVGAVIVAEIGLLASAWRINSLRPLALVALFVQIVSRCYFLYFRFDRFMAIKSTFSLLDITALIAGGVVAALLIWLMCRRLGSVVGVGLSALLACICGTSAFERNASVLERHTHLGYSLRQIEGLTVGRSAFLVDAVGRCQFFPYRYPLAKARDVGHGSLDALTNVVSDPAKMPFIVAIYHASWKPLQTCAEFDRLEDSLTKNGYAKVLAGPWAAAWIRSLPPKSGE